MTSLLATLQATPPAPVTNTNNTGVSVLATLETLPAAFISQSLGSQLLASVVFRTAAAKTGDGTPIAARLVWKVGALEAFATITLSGEESSAYKPLDPNGAAWTGDSLEGATIWVEADVDIPSMGTATLTVASLEAFAYVLAGRREVSSVTGAAAGAVADTEAASAVSGAGVVGAVESHGAGSVTGGAAGGER